MNTDGRLIQKKTLLQGRTAIKEDYFSTLEMYYILRYIITVRGNQEFLKASPLSVFVDFFSNSDCL